MSRADDIAARAARVTAHAAAAPDPEPVADAPTEPPVKRPAKAAPRVRPIRQTVDLDPARHRWFKQWLSAAAAQLELPSVHGSDVFRALLEEMAGDPGLAQRVTERLRR